MKLSIFPKSFAIDIARQFNRKIFILVCVEFIGLVLSPFIDAVELNRASYHELQMEIAFDNEDARYIATDVIPIKVRLKNTSSQSIQLFTSIGLEYCVSLFLREHNTRKYVPTDFFPSSPPPPSKEEFFELTQNQFLEKIIRLPLKNFKVRPDVKYDVIAIYRSSVPKSETFGLKNVWTSNSGVIYAEPISFQVVGQ